MVEVSLPFQARYQTPAEAFIENLRIALEM
jgi:hypothetical protein